MKKYIIAATAALIVLTTPAHAGKLKDLTNNLQYGAGIGSASVSGFPDSFFVFYGIAEKNLDIKLGNNIDSTAQLRIGTGTETSNTFYKVGLDYIVSGLYKATMDLDEIAVYGLGGFSYTSITATSTVSIPFLGTSTSSSSKTSFDLTFGIGADYEIDKDLKVAVEYQSIDQLDILGANVYFNF